MFFCPLHIPCSWVDLLQSHSAPTRARSVSVFAQCVTALFMVKDQHPQAVKEVTAQVLPVWLEAFKILLNLDPLQDVASDNWDGLTVRLQIFKVIFFYFSHHSFLIGCHKTLEALHTSFPRALVTYIPDLLFASLNHLRALYSTFSSYYLVANETPPNTSEEEPIELSQLICPIIDFLSSVIQSGKGRDWLSPENISTLIESVFAYVQMTDEDVILCSQVCQ